MSLTILVVEDEALVGMELQESLFLAGHRVPEVLSRGDLVVSAFERTKPDLVLMDIRIDGPIDGIEAASRLREVSPVPIVFLTAYNDAPTRRRLEAVKPEGVLVKPFTEAELTAVVTRLFPSVG